MYLEKIISTADVKKLNIDQLKVLADEVRAALIEKLSEHGGHIGPNLGIVEVTAALHYVFNSPIDKLVFDVSHQCYPHKMLTGRQKAFLSPAHYADVTGYTNPLESEHDFFTIGHTSTALSLATGLAIGRDLCGGRENIIAIVGDGALSGGETLEALNYAGEYDKNLIILINDNEQSIAENHGGLYQSLKNLRETNGESSNNIFKGFGLDYRYLEDGHNLEKLVELFESVKNLEHPIVLHIHTVKGRGLPYAEKEREKWHAGGPFHIEDGSPKFGGWNSDTTIFDSLIALLEENKKAVVVNAGTPMGLGFTKEIRPTYVRRGQFVDVGIAEETAMAMISGIAKNGGTPVFGTFAPFLQRTYDQLSHDLCLNDNPATILVLMPGVFGMNSNTHIALCDIAFFSHVPNLIYLSPASKEEYLQMFKFATTQREHPVALRIPPVLPATGVEDTTDYSIYNKFQVVQKGEDIALLGVGSLLGMAREAAEAYYRETGKPVTVIHPKFLTGLDETLLEDLKKEHKLVITMEDGELDGGFGQRVASFYGDSTMQVKNLGISKEFHTDFKAEELLAKHGMSVVGLVERMKQYQ